MPKKQIQKLIVGKWQRLAPGADMNATVNVFVPNPKQPPEPLTEIQDMVAWAKKEFDGELGTYQFIREVPGALECFQQTVMDFVVTKVEEEATDEG
jgi:hypothetical protein